VLSNTTPPLGQGEVAVLANGAFDYLAPVDLTGTVTFTYEVTDSQPAWPTATGTVTLRINEEPVLKSGAQTEYVLDHPGSLVLSHADIAALFEDVVDAVPEDDASVVFDSVMTADASIDVVASGARLRTIDLNLEANAEYTAVVLPERNLILEGEDVDITADATFLRIVHAAASVGQVDVWDLDEASMVIQGLGYGQSSGATRIPLRSRRFGLDIDADANPDLVYDLGNLPSRLGVLQALGTPYSDDEVGNAVALAQTQALEIATEVAQQGGPTGLEDREIVALVAFLQRLGTDLHKTRAANATPKQDARTQPDLSAVDLTSTARSVEENTP